MVQIFFVIINNGKKPMAASSTTMANSVSSGNSKHPFIVYAKLLEKLENAPDASSFVIKITRELISFEGISEPEINNALFEFFKQALKYKHKIRNVIFESPGFNKTQCEIFFKALLQCDNVTSLQFTIPVAQLNQFDFQGLSQYLTQHKTLKQFHFVVPDIGTQKPDTIKYHFPGIFVHLSAQPIEQLKFKLNFNDQLVLLPNFKRYLSFAKSLKDLDLSESHFSVPDLEEILKLLVGGGIPNSKLDSLILNGITNDVPYPPFSLDTQSTQHLDAKELSNNLQVLSLKNTDQGLVELVFQIGGLFKNLSDFRISGIRYSDRALLRVFHRLAHTRYLGTLHVDVEMSHLVEREYSASLKDGLDAIDSTLMKILMNNPALESLFLPEYIRCFERSLEIMKNHPHLEHLGLRFTPSSYIHGNTGNTIKHYKSDYFYCYDKLLEMLKDNRKILDVEILGNESQYGMPYFKEYAERNKRLKRQKQRTAFFMGYHSRVGQKSTIFKTVASSPINDRLNTTHLIFEFADFLEPNEIPLTYRFNLLNCLSTLKSRIPVPAPHSVIELQQRLPVSHSSVQSKDNIDDDVELLGFKLKDEDTEMTDVNELMDISEVLSFIDKNPVKSASAETDYGITLRPAKRRKL